MNQEVSMPQGMGGGQRNQFQNRSVDIQLVGAPGVGKTALLEAYVKEFDPQQLAKIQMDRSATGSFLGRYQIQSVDGALKINFLDCSGNPRAQSHIREYFQRSLWVFVVYDICNLNSFTVAKELLKQAHAAECRVLFFGNKFALDAQSGDETNGAGG